jgi:outer membrane protein OmpA-like peptidoglycan-associated protein/flagellar hook assembly protein FlgD
VWTGQDEDGRLVSDGTYRFSVSSTDRAGNSGESRPVEVVVNTERTPLSLAVGSEAFSPNGDRVLDTVDLSPTVGNRDGVERHRLRILNDEGEVVRTIEGSGLPPARFQWDGRSDARVRLPDGSYTAELLLVYRHGNEPQAQTDTFVLDTTAPEVDVSTQFTLFSPNGDGNRDVVFIRQTSSREDRWTGRILTSTGDVVRTYNWEGSLDTVEWNGTDEAGNRVPDGAYEYQVVSTDAAGNRGEASVAGLTVDTRPTRVFVTAGARGLSPNGDGQAERIEFSMYVNLTDGADSWQLDMVRDDDTLARRFSGTSVRSNFTQTWNGRTEDGELLEGAYAAVFTVFYAKGNEPTARTTEFNLDVSPPSIDVTLDGLPFSPDNDGLNDELRILMDVEDLSGIESWEFRILDRNNRPFNVFSGTGRPSSAIIWDGRSSTGDTVISAEDYPYELEVVDSLGNEATRTGLIPIDILVVRDGNRLKVQIASITFQPNSPELVVDPATEQGQKNLTVLRRLVEVFDKYRDYDIRIEGHAVNVTGTEREEREELQPLSLARAQEVKEALVGLGMSERRISTLGRGGTEPVVPHTDLEERWKNRRVEFILIR